MRRYLKTGSAAALLALAAGTASAQISIVQPVVGDDEFAGLNTIVTFDVAGGLNAGGIVLDGEALEMSFDLVDAAGNVVFGPFSVDTVGGAVNYADAGGNAGVQVDFGDVTFANALANPTVTGIRLKARTAGGTAMMFEQAPFDAGDESMDDVLEAVKIGDAPVLQAVFISTDGMSAFFQFSESLNVGAGGNDDNQTVLADIDGTDFQIDSADSFDGTEGAPAGLSNPAFLGGNNEFLQFDRNDMTSDLDVGTFVRPAFDNMAASTNDIFSIVGYAVTDAAVEIAEVDDLTIESVEALSVVESGDGASAMVVRVNFNLPLDGGDLGDDTFYGDFLQLAAGGDSTLDITGIAIDPENGSAVLLSLNAGVGDGIAANATNPNGTTLTLDTDIMGDVPSSIFGTDDYATAQSLTLTDAINPALSGDVTGLVYQDTNGDGVQDAVLFVFTESLDSGLDGADADDLGITLTRNAGVTITPIGSVDPVSGEWTTYNTVASADPADDEIAVTSIEVVSFDADDDGMISDLETNNAIRANFDPAQDFEVAGGGWDNDDTTTAGTGDGPGTGDDNAVQGEIDADMSDITDANGVSIDSDTEVADSDDIDEDSQTDGAAPVAVTSLFKSGDNFNGGFFESFVETDGGVGDDDDNNVFYGVFGEPVTIAGDNPSLISWGPGATQRFQAADTTRSLGANNNILQIEDGGARGFAAGDTLTFSAGHMIDDGAGNEIAGPLTAADGTSPFVALQTDINGVTRQSAFLFDSDDDGFADGVRLFTDSPVDAATVLVGDFTHSGGDDFREPVMGEETVNAAGTQITLFFMTGANIPSSNNVTVVYTAPANNDDAMSQIIAGTDGNAVFPGLTTTITATPFPTPDVDADDLAIMDISGTITSGGNPIGVGAKVFGMVAVPMPKMISGQMFGLDFWVDDDSSLEAFANFIYGFEDHLYFFDDDGELYFNNEYEDNSGNNYAIFDIAVNASNLGNVTFTGRGRTYTQGDSTPQTGLTVSGGRVTMGWDVLRSGDGDTQSLKQGGFSIGGPAIASRAVVENTDGNYDLHLSAPITQFYGSFGQTGWPVIIVVERATGERTAVTSVLNAVDNAGSLLFNPLQRTTTPNTSTARAGGANVDFDIDLSNVGMEYLYEGWSLLPFNRVSGFARANGNIPTLPAIQGGSNTNVRVGSTLPLVRAFNQFAFFYDNDEDNEWNSDDDGSFMDSLVVDVDCFDHMRFVMSDRGVNIGSNVNAFVGGYGAGFFNGTGNNLGVFQFGAAGSASTVFTGSFSSSSTLGWAIVTAPAGNTDPGDWLADNTSDFVIEFNRISNGEVDVNTFGTSVNGINDVSEINAGQAYFVSFE